jgi:hypothetical protein
VARGCEDYILIAGEEKGACMSTVIRTDHALSNRRCSSPISCRRRYGGWKMSFVSSQLK